MCPLMGDFFHFDAQESVTFFIAPCSTVRYDVQPEI